MNVIKYNMTTFQKFYFNNLPKYLIIHHYLYLPVNKIFGLCPTGTFQTSNKIKDAFNVLPELKLTRQINWPGGVTPLSVPLCGFHVKFKLLKSILPVVNMFILLTINSNRTILRLLYVL